MGQSVYPAASSAALPVGATEKVASGFTQSGYAAISGTFAAGKYLVVADTACNVNFTSAADVNGYQSAVFSRGGSCVINVPVSTSVIEYTAMPSLEEYQSTNYNSTLSTYESSFAATTRLPKFNADGMPSSWAKFGYKGKYIALTSAAVIWKSTDWENGTNTGLSAGVGGTNAGMVGTDGTTWRGSVGAATMWSTTNPEAGAWSTQSLPVNFSNVIYGNGVWLAIASGSTSYAYSTNGTSWTAGTLPLNPPEYSPIAFGNGKFVLTGSSSYSATKNIYYSTDGVNWTNVTIGGPEENAGNRTVHGVAFGNGRFVTGWGSTVATTDIKNPSTFVSFDGVNWVPGSKCPYSATVGSGIYQFFPIFDGTGFNIVSRSNGSYGWRTIDGFNRIPVTGNSSGWATFGVGSRGNYIDSAGPSRLNATKTNSTFSIYKLDSSYTTY